MYGQKQKQPNFLGKSFLSKRVIMPRFPIPMLTSAYVVPRGGVASLKTVTQKDELGREVQTWIQSKVARHKYLRGGVVVVDSIPKR